jgi:FAD/FMN-containing dehydrogenase/Fe-S oxidoreductase
MLPILTPEFAVDAIYLAYLDALKVSAFSGEIRADYAARLAVATDNSIYQVIPQAVILPKTTADIALALRLGSEERFRAVKFSPRGGGVAANGQSLSSSIIIDCSKYMRDILELNLQEGWVRVQPGVVQDQLNQYLLPYGMHFAPEISPSNRATLGGMINTDACGNGQKIIGRTSDHIVELTAVLSDGTVFSSLASQLPMLTEITQLLSSHQALIKQQFPAMPRTLSGYNLLKAYQGKLNLNYLLAGSEGTLAIVSECKLKLTPLPNYKTLVVVQYRQFDDALQALDITADIKPLVIECIDERLLDLARQDEIYFYVKDFIENQAEKTGAINLVEFIADTKSALDEEVQKLCAQINSNKQKLGYAIGYYITKNELEIKKLWELRKKSVGLISKNKVGSRRPIPFIEDTAVKPEQLVAYIREFKALLDQYQLEYGMYGHVDAGCVHVRPALDLQLPADEKLHQALSHDIVALLQKYGGVMWGEHGMGFRVEFSEMFFGKELYNVVRAIKTLFDPYNKLNPGKVAIPFDCAEELVQLSGPLRAQFDSQIPRAWQNEYESALACNGNGACFSYATQETLCPSFKVTKDRIHSPKGRAALVKEWLRQLKLHDFQFVPNLKFVDRIKKIFQRKQACDFSHEVLMALNGCLGCKACTAQCPLNVDVPELKAKFLNYYFQRYWRSPRDYAVAAIERIAKIQACFPRLSNRLVRSRVVQRALNKYFHLTDVPAVSEVSIAKELQQRNAPALDLKLLNQLTSAQKENSVIIVQDAFTRFYYPELLLKTYDVLQASGFVVYVAPFFVNGKPYYANGFINKFERIAKRNINYLNQLAATDIAMIGLDPSITLTYRDEYKKSFASTEIKFSVSLPQEWLSMKSLATAKVNSTTTYFLLSHCTEKTLCVAAEKQWVSVFAKLGLVLKPIAVGCCGMAGSYGHEVEHVELSRKLFQYDWLPALQKNDENAVLLATGYSCRSQAQRFHGASLLHPMEALWRELGPVAS